MYTAKLLKQRNIFIYILSWNILVVQNGTLEKQRNFDCTMYVS